MRRALLIDSKRAWGKLLHGRECIDITSVAERLSQVKSGDLLLLHTSDGLKKDREALLKMAKSERPIVVLITGGPSKKLPTEWKAFAAKYGASILEGVPWFTETESLPRSEQAKYIAHLHQLFGESRAHPDVKRPDSLLEKMEHAVAVNESIQPLVASLRFWLDAKLGAMILSENGVHHAYDELTIWTPLTNPEEMKWFLLPGPTGIGWGDLFSGRMSATSVFQSWLKKDGIGAKAIELILDPSGSVQAAKTWAEAKDPVTGSGGAIRLLYEIAARGGKNAKIRPEWLIKLTPEMERWKLGRWGNLLKAALCEGETVVSHSTRVVARAEFTCAGLVPNEDERSVLHHNTLRQEVLQRLISHDVAGQLSTQVEDNIEPARVAELALLMANCNTTDLSPNMQSAFDSWRGTGAKSGKGVKEALCDAVCLWRSPDRLESAGLALKASEAVRLDKVVAAISYMDSIISSGLSWQRHISLGDEERCAQAKRFWVEAATIMESLKHWHAAPTRLLEFYDEV